MIPTSPAPLRLVATAALLVLSVPASAQPSRDASPTSSAGPSASVPESAPPAGRPTSPSAAAASAVSAAAVDTGLYAASEGLQRVTVTGAADNGYGTRASSSATGLDLDLRETPQSITVISREQMDDFALDTINDVLGLTPGVTVQRVETDRTYFSARGFDITNFQVDGIGMPFTNGNQAGDLDTAFYDRIDIALGANGLLSATGNPSATVNFIRKRPTRELEASAQLSLGSWNDRRIDADVAGPLNTSGTLRGRAIAFGQERNSYLDRYGLSKQGVATLLAIDLDPRTTLGVNYMQQSTQADSPMWGALPLTYTDGTPTHYDISTSTAANWAFWNNTERRADIELAHDFGESWQGQATVTRRILTANSELFYVFGHPDPVTQLGPMSYPSSFAGEYGQTIADLRFSGPFTLGGRTHSAVFGADWARENAFETSGYGPADSIGVVLPDLETWDGSFPKPDFNVSHDGSRFDTTRRTVFAAAHLNLADTLNAIVGASATSLDSSGQNYGVPHEFSRSAVTPYLGAVVDLSGSTSAYASYTRIFNPQTEIDAQEQPLQPIEGSSVEAGLKSEWFAKKLMTSVAVFRTRQDNTAVQDIGTFPARYHPEDAISTGFELAASGRLAPGWDINGGYTQFRLEHPDGTPVNTFVPRRTLQLATAYRLPALPAAKIGGTLRWQDDIHQTNDNGATIRQPAYAVLGLMAQYEFATHWSATLRVDNVTNDKHLTSLYWNQAYYDAPRSVSASVRWTY